MEIDRISVFGDLNEWVIGISFCFYVDQLFITVLCFSILIDFKRGN